MVGKNGGMRRIPAAIRLVWAGDGGFSNDGVSRYVNLHCLARGAGNVGTNSKESVESTGRWRCLHRAPGNSTACRAGNDHGTIDLAARQAQQGGNHHGRQSAHASKTHRHPKRKVWLRLRGIQHSNGWAESTLVDQASFKTL